ncbi:inositol monophosphatase family protein [Rhodovarius crocodyli]|nr:inositol monophosphatase family protein [Rhodovarius crocodyli]
MSITHAQQADVAALLKEAASREIMPRFRQLLPADIRAKSGPLDLVTDADEGAEKIIAAGLARIFPGCLVVGEEGCAADPALLARLADAPLAFVVDPVDGTANFAAGLPLFGVMVAAIRHGETIASWIYDPITRDIAMALRGEGAFTETPDGLRRDMRVGTAQPLSRTVGMVAWHYMSGELQARLLPRLSVLGGAQNLRCSAHEWWHAAAGNLQLLVYNRLMPWDHAPGWLLHREAGGYSARFDGSAYTPLETYGGIIATPDRASWQAAKEALGL